MCCKVLVLFIHCYREEQVVYEVCWNVTHSESIHHGNCGATKFVPTLV